MGTAVPVKRKHEEVCFGCGKKNLHGMHLAFEPTGDEALRTSFLVEEKHQGIPNLLHGGIISLVFDELMAAYCAFFDKRSLTASLSVKFLKPVRVGQTITFEARQADRRGDFLKLEGLAADEKGKTVAKAKALMKLVQRHDF